MYDREKIIERASQLARGKDPGLYYLRNDPDFKLIWRAKVAEEYPRACMELYPPNIGYKWAMGRFLITVRKQISHLLLSLKRTKK